MSRSPPAKAQDSASQAVRIHTLGRFLIEVDGQPLRLGAKAQRKPLELLKVLLALGGQDVPELELSDTLWPESDGDQAHRVFVTNLHRLRKLIGHEAIRLEDGRLSMVAGACWVDTLAFQALLANAARAAGEKDDGAAWNHMESALALYRGPFLAGEFNPPEILSARDRLHGLFLRHIDELGRLLLEKRQIEKASLLYLKGLEIDDLAEEFYQHLMRCYLEQGRLAEGISAYQRCRRIFRAKMDLDPSPKTEALHQTLLANQAGKSSPQETIEEVNTETPPQDEERLAPSGPSKPFGERRRAAETAAKGRVRPSIAVLPFKNMSGNPEQDYFSDGITEDLITDLSKISRLSVISKKTVFSYEARAVNLRQVGEELGVQYILEGSVRKGGSRVRITAQLIEAATEQHLWSERYDRSLDDIFEVQDEITAKIETALDVQLLEGEQGRVWRESTSNPDAYYRFLRGRNIWHSSMNPEGAAKAERLYEEAIELDPTFARAYASLAFVHVATVRFGWSKSSDESLERGFELAQKSIALDDTLDWGHTVLSGYYVERRQYELALEEGEKAIALNPAGGDVHVLHALGQVVAGEATLAVENVRKAMRLTPDYPVWYPRVLGLAYFTLREYEQAVAALQEALAGVPDYWVSHVLLAASYAALHRNEEAQAEVREVLRLDPHCNSAEAGARMKYKNRADLRHFTDLLRKAGLPE